MIYQVSKEMLSLNTYIEFRFIHPYMGRILGLKGYIRGFVTYPHTAGKALVATEYHRMLAGLSDEQKLLVDTDVTKATFLIVETDEDDIHYICPDWIDGDSILMSMYLYEVKVGDNTTLESVANELSKFGYVKLSVDQDLNTAYLGNAQPDRKESIELILNNVGLIEFEVTSRPHASS